ncbi:MFS general substrate transporter [Testicularia cyperi]|uniref:MFS general substrate transporter n=1 Tax=Testicularia cyperi TaxID=1882483 RepID=A0A317XQN2_9BASI|nr:MFS general substrate transporter [Testicularia cyperi]
MSPASPTIENGRGSENLRGSTASPTAQVTLRFRLVVLWILVSAFNYGYGISELNPLQPILTCQQRDPHAPEKMLTLSPLKTGCIPLTESQFGLATSLFTLGGLVSSFMVSPVSKWLGWGRKRSIFWSAVSGVLGSALLACASDLWSIGLGRFIQGVGSGIGVVMVPIYLNEISPVSIQGSIGVLNQLSIVIGVFVAQALGGSPLGSSGSSWRFIPLASAVLSLTQLAGAFILAVESPGWLEGEGASAAPSANSRQTADEIRALLWSPKALQGHKDSQRRATSSTTGQDEERTGLLADQDGPVEGTSPDAASRISHNRKAGLTDLFTDPEIRPGAILVALTQLGQQLSGINAVLYYSVGIMGSILPSLAGSIGIMITFINILMTFPPIYLIDEHRLGRKKLIISSALVMSFASFLLGVGIIGGYKALSATSMILMTAAFSFGLGPVPFVVLPELVPARAVSTTTSLGLTLNWTANFLVGSAFLPFKNWVSQFDAQHTGGAAFWIFTIFNLLIAVLMGRMYNYSR